MVDKKKSRTKPGKKRTMDGSEALPLNVDVVTELETRFLSYALSTIVSRALPDVRDGLKPVHRRVLYAMHQLRLNPDARYRKSAAVVGDVIGKYHPHGDQAVYDTMVRLAQDFSLRYPLVDGQGNFGNVDGDSAAAMRYTEAKLTNLATELTSELKKETVDFSLTYDQLLEEPKLMPARFPNLLVNGSSGIAVGLATNIPPHNLTETIDGLVALISNRKMTVNELLSHIKGPDFPTGAEIVASKAELREVYESGRGAIKVRGQWALEKLPKGKWQIIVTSIPYTVNKSKLIEKIAELIINGKMTDLVDVRDESTEIMRIVLEPKTLSVDAALVMAYLYKHSDLALSFPVNLTALTKEATPHRHSLHQMLISFLDFRFEVTEKRLSYDLRIIEERLHLLTALAKVYNDLDKAVQIIRQSKIRDEARTGLMNHFKLDDVQANAILDLRLAALVGLEISKIKKEKAEKEAERELILKVLAKPSNIWNLVRKELLEIKATYGDKRKTKIIATERDIPEYDAESYIQHEETNLIVSQGGWVRRMKTVSNPDTLRFKEGDSLMAWIPCNTRDLVCFFTSFGKLYATRVLDITLTTGHGEPVQSMFKFGDGERVVSVLGVIQPMEGEAANDKGKAQAPLFDQLKKSDMGKIYGEVVTAGKVESLLAVLEGGNGFQFSSETLTATNKNGRKVANVKGDDALYSISRLEKKSGVFILTSEGKGILLKTKDVITLSGPGGGVRLIKLKPPAYVKGVKPVGPKDKITIMYKSGRDDTLKVAALETNTRGGTGRKVAGVRKIVLGLAKTD